MTAARTTEQPRTAAVASLRGQVLAALVAELTATRTVVADSDTARRLEERHPGGRTFEHGGEHWTEFTAVPDEDDGFTVHYDDGVVGMWKTADLGGLADAIADRLTAASRPAVEPAAEGR